MLTMARPTVLLPQPDSPTRPRVSPSCRSKLTPSTARTSAILRASTPPTTGNRTERSRISRSFASGIITNQVAADPVAGTRFKQLRLDRFALLEFLRAAGYKLAADGEVENTRYIAGNGAQSPLLLSINRE